MGFVRVGFAVLIAALLAVAVMPSRARAEQALLLEVMVNGHSTGKIGEFVQRDDALLARRHELDDLGFRLPESASASPDDLIALSELPGLAWRLDLASQTVFVTADLKLLKPALLELEAPTSANVPVQSGLGATLNYDVTATTTGGHNVGNGLIDTRVFSPWGVLSSSELAYAGSSPYGPGTNAALRLDSSYVYSDPDALRQYSVGDVINGGLAWTRPVRMGGVQVTQNFSMRPDLVTMPLPTVSGAVAVPSTVDVLVNGSQLLARQVQAGPFQIPSLPVMTGSSTIAMTMTDALGHQVTTTMPFYASQNLLAAGLQTFSVEAGAVRRNYGLPGDTYADIAGSASYRRGLTSMLTVEAHAEGIANQAMAGTDVMVNVANFGILDAAVAASTASGRNAALYSIGFNRTSRTFSAGASATFAGHDFADIASLYGDPMPRRQINANASLSMGQFGSIGLAYTGIDRDAAPAPISFYTQTAGLFANQISSVAGGTVSTFNGLVTLQPAEHTHIITASYSVQVFNMSFYATGFHDLVRGGGTGALIGMTVPLGQRSSIGGSAGTGSIGGYQQIQAQQSVQNPGDRGYQAYASTSAPAHTFADVQYKSPWALVSAGVDRIGAQNTGRAEVQGAVSLADGGVYASNQINDSFAVVDTDGAAGVTVLRENQPVGKTDSNGRLLVPDLRSFDINHLTIDPTDVALDATVDTATHEVRPQYRSGVVVPFHVRIGHGALLRLVDKAGKPLPLGSVATLQATGVGVPVGYGGEAYVQDLDAHNTVNVTGPKGSRCAVSFDFTAKPNDIPTIGPLTCQENGS